jgi:hypothetical protein
VANPIPAAGSAPATANGRIASISVALTVAAGPEGCLATRDAATRAALATAPIKSPRAKVGCRPSHDGATAVSGGRIVAVASSGADEVIAGVAPAAVPITSTGAMNR